MFVQKLNQITEQTHRECQGRFVKDYLIYAIYIWCKELGMNSDITSYIVTGYNQYKVSDLTDYIYREWEPSKPKERSTSSGWEEYYELSKLYSIVNKTIFSKIKIRNEPVGSGKEKMEFIVLVAFGIAAIGYVIYLLNQPKQQEAVRREEPRQDNPNLPVETPPILTTPVQTITKQFLVLVVSASQADFLESLKSKGRINVNDGEELYKITKYLWLGAETDFNQKRSKINRHEVSKGAESEYDIYLIYIDLNQADEGFNQNVNQLGRYDAFRKLDNLVVNLEISPRLQMEAYENLEVYSR